ncbi:hypothetical protein ABID37_003635 [Aquamicrobium terrae]|uniref:Uncharacterized protein n=1 Tax=Aquamicrobium terrae TaxID=1324945 RepID=A0ABV2N4I8_9HYPH
MEREEWRRSRQGKKVADGRCGRTIEAKPVSGQTCHIEPQKGLVTRLKKRTRGHGVRTPTPHPDEIRLETSSSTASSQPALSILTTNDILARSPDRNLRWRLCAVTSVAEPH